MRRLALLMLFCCGTTALAKPTRPPPPPPEPAKGCEWAGPGYVKLQGTETCVKVGGAVRAEFSGTK